MPLPDDPISRPGQQPSEPDSLCVLAFSKGEVLIRFRTDGILVSARLSPEGVDTLMEALAVARARSGAMQEVLKAAEDILDRAPRPGV